MKIQIAAVLSTDCYLLSPAKGINSRWAFPKQHTLFSLRNETDLLLSKDTLLAFPAIGETAQYRHNLPCRSYSRYIGFDKRSVALRIGG